MTSENTQPVAPAVLTSETQKPTRRGVEWLRGEDPWHSDSWKGTPLEGKWKDEEPCKMGWYGCQNYGNIIGFIPDGSPVNAPLVKLEYPRMRLNPPKK